MVINKVLLSQENWYFWNKGDFHSNFGIIKEKDILKGGMIKSNKGNIFYVFDANFFDKMQKIKRLPQAIMEKDIASILMYADINKKSIVLEAGTGSGKLCSYLARYSKKIFSFEINEQFIEVAKENFKDLNLKNIEIKKGNIYEKIDLKEKVDAVCLDLPESWEALKNVENNLKPGGVFVSYLPTIVQVINLVKESQKYNLKFIKCIENTERSWIVENERVRPENKTQFTAFLVFFRKY
ncbi:methyltransferase domain-containing protein [Candidatus Woesearchaeota archaeon]|nr:methyltransferase domain-containing protein [Candidatus Woesearchaeota archaeon]